MKVSYNKDLLQLMQVFDKVTRTPLKDCVDVENGLYFIVPQGTAGKAIGKGASNVKTLQHKLQRRIKIIEFNEDCAQFIRNALHPLQVDDVQVVEGVATIRSSQRETRALIIGRSAKNLNTLTELVQRYFPITEIKVEDGSSSGSYS